jgi:HK97 family phage portal protein
MRLFSFGRQKEKRASVQVGEVAWLTGNRDEIYTADDALKVGAVFACVRVIAETLSTLPCILYRRLPGGGKERATDHPLYGVLHDTPNPIQDSVQFFEMLTGHVVLRGNAYAQIDFTPGGTTMTPLHPGKVSVKIADNGRYKYYEYWDGNRTRIIKPQNMLHIYGLSSDGLIGLSPIELAMRTVTLARKQELYADTMFTNKASPGGVLKHPGKLSDIAAKRLKEDFERKYAGTDKTGTTMLLEEGMEWQQVGLSNEQAQFIQGRKFSKSDIAMWFRIPPHKIGDLEKATFSNIEHQALEFVTDTIRPWLVRWEKALMRTLFTPEERQEYTIEFLADAILRGDTQSRYNAYSVARQWGWMNVDEIRERENMNPLPDDKGKIYLQPMNMVEPGEDEPSDMKEPDEEDTDEESGSSEEQPDAEDSSDNSEDEANREIALRCMEPVIVAILERSNRRKEKIKASKGWDQPTAQKERGQFQTDIEPILRGLGMEHLRDKVADTWENNDTPAEATVAILGLLRGA